MTRYKYTLSYILLIVLLNTLFAKIPLVTFWGAEISPMDPAVGIVYVLRDFVQREIQHRVIGAMLIGAVLSYFLADKGLAIASICSFLVAEFVDWTIYTFTKRPFSKRILWSATASSPVDSIVFLAVIHRLNWLGVVVLSATKILGVLLIWYMYRIRERQQIAVQDNALPAS